MNGKPRQSAFTLIEVVIVVAIIGILLTLALPSYRQFIHRAHRSEAIAVLLQVSVCQERVRALRGTYDTLQCLPEAGPHYRFRYADPATDDTGYYQVQAEPRGAQRSDRCGMLILDALGRRSTAAESASAPNCWSGR